MKKPLLLTFTLFTLALPAVSENAHAEQIEVRPAQVVEHNEKKPGFFERLFKRRKEDEQKEDKSGTVVSSTPPTKKAIATEASEIEEKPKSSRPRKSTRTPTPSKDEVEVTNMKPELSSSPGPDFSPESPHLTKTTATPKSISGPESESESTPNTKNKSDISQLAQPIPFVPTPEPENSVATAVPDLLDPDYVKRINERYKKVRSEALADKKVSVLKDEADGAFDPPKRAEALKIYYEALFQKMREIDPSLKGRIDGREKATMRRIESLAPTNE